ncbi:histone acetyltransferase HAC12-like [Abrus precatorius]|uniref:histone acetyltransferase n=1 Tax=Abrus precatorius TaxID=3816 RepID=A0A8B8K0A3_ABRPR|nr:histone acetyltransferase HAC12-like [Abrus precatorius]
MALTHPKSQSLNQTLSVLECALIRVASSRITGTFIYVFLHSLDTIEIKMQTEGVLYIYKSNRDSNLRPAADLMIGRIPAKGTPMIKLGFGSEGTGLVCRVGIRFLFADGGTELIPFPVQIVWNNQQFQGTIQGAREECSGIHYEQEQLASDIANMLENWLFIDAASKEEYMNLDTLIKRLETQLNKLHATKYSHKNLNGVSQANVIKYLHSTVCCKGTCTCEQYSKLLLHFDGCRCDDCQICYSLKLRGTDILEHQFEFPNSVITGSVVGENDAPSVSSEAMLPPKKRRKMEGALGVSLINNASSDQLTPKMVQPCSSEALSEFQQHPEPPLSSIYSEVTESNVKEFTISNPMLDSISNVETKNNVIDDTVGQTFKIETVISKGLEPDHVSEEPDFKSHDVKANSNLKETVVGSNANMHSLCKDPRPADIEHIQGRTRFNKVNGTKRVIEPKADQDKETRSSNPTVNTVSLTDFFTSNQLMEHIMSLRRQFVQNPTDEEPENADYICQLCEMGQLYFAQIPIYCYCCSSRIKENANYYQSRGVESDTHHCFCTVCYKNSRGSHITFNGTSVSKSLLDKMENSEASDEPALVAENLSVRVVLSVDKQLKVKKEFMDIFPEENYPAEFSYTSKVILLFQQIEGVDVCLFGMYVQEFGSECGYPNQGCVYISYLDSVKYFRPERETMTGEALRTFVYHEILIGYLDFCKKQGFTTCYLWACPPLKGDDYILYCHPVTQKTPKKDKLRNWYHSMLRKAAEENIVVGLTNMYDHFFVPTGNCDSKVSAACLPYFDGDYWSGAAMDIARKIEHESGGEYEKTLKKLVTKRTKAMGHVNPSKETAKNILVMKELGQIILPVKEDFIMIHLQSVCIHCHEVIVSGKRWFCTECKKFQECERCHTSNSHTSIGGKKHTLCQVLMNDIIFDTKENDIILDNGLFEDRQKFLSFCQKKLFQFDTLRQAKYSSMMILHHLKNPTVPVGTKCSICFKHNNVLQWNWKCEICPEFTVCFACYKERGAICHVHKLSRTCSGNKESMQNLMQELQDVILHASQCHSTRTRPCTYPHCLEIKKLFSHASRCTIRVSGGCQYCMKAWMGITAHCRNCKDSGCGVPRCMCGYEEACTTDRNAMNRSVELQLWRETKHPLLIDNFLHVYID